jgi:hypothetical protein
MKNVNAKTIGFGAAAMLALALLGAGCASHHKEVQVEETADSVSQNHLLVRAAAAENVYNAIAAERAVYPKDFAPGSADLNELGAHRVDMLIDVSRHATGHITILRGDAEDVLYTARVDAVRKEFADAGIDLEKLTIAKGGTIGGGVPSEEAVLAYKRMLSDYTPQQQSAQTSGSGFTSSGMSGQSGTSSSSGTR